MRIDRTIVAQPGLSSMRIASSMRGTPAECPRRDATPQRRPGANESAGGIGTETGEQSVAVCFADDGRPVRFCKPVSNIAKGAEGSVTLYDYDGTTETAGSTVTAKALMAAVTGGGCPKWCTAVWDGRWYVLPGEC